LDGFQRVRFPAGQSKTLQIAISAQRLAYWDKHTQALEVEATPIVLLAGDSSTDLPLQATVQVQ
jgi:hypothetical protein